LRCAKRRSEIIAAGRRLLTNVGGAFVPRLLGPAAQMSGHKGPSHIRVSAMRQVELQIVDVAFGGKGIGRDEGKAVFIPFTIEGERVTAKIVREKKQFAEGELVEILDPSPRRVAPGCPYFGRCGGWSYQD